MHNLCIQFIQYLRALDIIIIIYSRVALMCDVWCVLIFCFVLIWLLYCSFSFCRRLVSQSVGHVLSRSHSSYFIHLTINLSFPLFTYLASKRINAAQQTFTSYFTWMTKKKQVYKLYIFLIETLNLMIHQLCESMCVCVYLCILL